MNGPRLQQVEGIQFRWEPGKAVCEQNHSRPVKKPPVILGYQLFDPIQQ